MNNRVFSLPALEDEQQEQFAISPLMNELAKQQALTTPIQDEGSQESMMNQEMSQADEIAAESKDLMGSMPQEEKASNIPQKSMLEKYMQLKALQDQQRDSLQNIGYIQAANQIAQGIASKHGARIGAGEEGIKSLQAQAQQPVKDYLQQQEDESMQMKLQNADLDLGNEKQLNDPQSDISKFKQQQAVAMAKRLGMNDELVSRLTGMTAKQLDKLGFGGNSQLMNSFKTQQSDYETTSGQPLSFDPITNSYTNILTGEPHRGEVRRKIINQFVDPNTGDVVLRDRTNLMPLGKAPVSQTPKEQPITRTNLNPKQKELLDKTRDSIEKNPQYMASQEAGDAAESTRALLKGNKIDGVILRALQNKIARATGEKGAMTENDVAPFGGQQGILDRLQRYAQYKTVGQLPQEDVKFLNNLVTTLEGAAKRNIDQVNYVYTKQLSDDLGVDLRQASGLLNTNERLAPKELSKETGDKVRVISPEGKVGYVPKQNLEKALKKGFKKADQ